MRIAGLIGLGGWQQSRISSGWILLLLGVSGLGAIGLVLLSALWAGQESDAAALDRQRQLVNSRLREQVEQYRFLVERVAEGYLNEHQPLEDFSTVEHPPGDTSAMTRASATALGRATVSAFGIEQAFVVDDQAQLFMMPNRALEKRYRWMKPLFMSLLKEQFARTRGSPAIEPLAATSGSPEERAQSRRAAAHLMRLEGRPAIVAAALVNEGLQSRDASRHYLVAVRFLDGAALDQLSAEQGLNGARYARSADQDETEVAFQITATSGEPIGMIIWQPDLPGSRVVQRLVPALSGAVLIIAIMFSFLLMRLRVTLLRLKDSEAKSRKQALHDALTGLPNRVFFSIEFERRLSKLKAGDDAFVVALLDLDRFKGVNDTHGHAAGDELIVAAVNRVRGLLMADDLLARVGGDEFALLLSLDHRDNSSLADLCDRIILELGQPFNLSDGDAVARVGGSLGFSIVRGSDADADVAMKHADTALYQAKSQGRGQWQRYSVSMDHERSSRDELRDELRDLLAGTALNQPAQNVTATGVLEVYYQTVHRPRQGFKPSGAEALVRWHHPAKGTLSPPAFVPLAEEAGLIDALGLWVLREACRAAQTWPHDGFIAVNVSPSQLRCPNFASEVFKVLEETGLDARRLELELTESSLLQDNEEVSETLRTLRAVGIQISLDDFGTGYSCLSHLLQFEVDRIKIDRSFVAKIGLHESGLSIVRTVVQLAHDLGMATTAEGVETEEQRDFLKAIGCTDLQGYLFARPQPLNAIEWGTESKHSVRLTRHK